MEIDGELAKKLFAEGAALVLLDVPERTEFGIDYNSWTVGPKFKGVKMIPPGFHFIYYSAADKQTSQLSPRTGFFHFFKHHEVLVKKWDAMLEDISDRDVTDNLKSRITQNLRDMDRFLGAYPYESLAKWVSLTNHITEDLVTRLEPPSGQLSSVTQVRSQKRKSKTPLSSADPAGCIEMDEEEGNTKRSAVEDLRDKERLKEADCGEDKREGQEMEEMELGDSTRSKDADDSFKAETFAGVGEFVATAAKDEKTDLLQTPRLRDLDMRCVEEAALRFSTVPSKSYPEGSTPAQISHHNMDLSFAMTTMIDKEYSGSEMKLLGELQFTFICFLIGQVYDAFEHWKVLVKLSCFSEAALASHKTYFTHFITVMHFQLQEIPEDFFVDIVSRNNFLTTTLQTFFSNLEECGSAVDPDLVKKGLKFKENLTKKYKWDFSSEPDDFAPTVVELT